MKKYLIKSIYWDSYKIAVNKKGVVYQSTQRPNNKTHWVVGWEFKKLKEYYNKDKVSITEIKTA